MAKLATSNVNWELSGSSEADMQAKFNVAEQRWVFTFAGEVRRLSVSTHYLEQLRRDAEAELLLDAKM